MSQQNSSKKTPEKPHDETKNQSHVELIKSVLQQEQSKQEKSKQEQSKQEQSKQEQLQQENSQQEQSKQEQLQQIKSQQEKSQQEKSQQEQSQQEESPKSSASYTKSSEKKSILTKHSYTKSPQTKSAAIIKHSPCDVGGACGLHCIKMTDIGVTIGKTKIIEHINLHIHCGKLTVIIGRNGAGKSTLIKAMLGEIKHEGTIEFRDMKQDALSNLRIGYVPQHLNVEKNTPTSVYDMFASFISNRPVFFRQSKKLYQQILKHLEMFEAQELIDKRVCDLSGGELQRVLLSIACTPTPNLLLLDEPVSGIDRNGMELFYRNIDRLKREFDLALILVSHDLEFVEKYADHVILLDKSIIKEGSAKEVLYSKEFDEIFGSTRKAWV